MARPKSVDWNGAPVVNEVEVGKRVSLERGRLATFLKQLIEAEGISPTEWGRRIGVGQSTVSSTLHGKRPFSPRFLAAASLYFNLEYGELFSAARAAAEQKGEGAQHLVAICCRTHPHSFDRLEKIVQAVAPAGADKSLLALYYTSQMFELAAPDYVHKYLDGGLSDDAVYTLLKEVADNLATDGNFWGEVKKRVGRDDGGAFSEIKG